MKCPRCGLAVFKANCEECKRRHEFYKCPRCEAYWRNMEYVGEPTPLELLSPPLRKSLENGELEAKTL